MLCIFTILIRLEILAERSEKAHGVHMLQRATPSSPILNVLYWGDILIMQAGTKLIHYY